MYEYRSVNPLLATSPVELLSISFSPHSRFYKTNHTLNTGMLTPMISLSHMLTGSVVMPTEASNVIRAFVCTMNVFIHEPIFRRLMVAIIGDLRIDQVITETDVYATTTNGHLVYTPNASVIISLCHITSLFIQLVTHAAHHAPLGTVASPLWIPETQASELGLRSEEDLSFAELRQRANDLVHLQDVSKDEVVRELREYFEELSIRFVWLEERMEHSACLGFESTMNWGAWFGWTWSQFLVTYYPQVVRNTAEAWDISIAQLLTHYSSEDSRALSTYVASMDTIVPYDPNMPAFDIDLSATRSSFELADSISNMATGSSSVGGLLSREKVGQWWPTISVEDGRVFLILYDDEGVEVRRKAIDWSELTKNGA